MEEDKKDSQEVLTSGEAQQAQFLSLLAENPSPALSANSKLEQGEVDEDTWREEIYQWLQTLKNFFLHDLKSYQRFDRNQQVVSSQPKMDFQIDREYLDDFIELLEMAKDKIGPHQKEKIANLENTLIHIPSNQQSTSSHRDDQNTFQSDKNVPENVNQEMGNTLPRKKEQTFQTSPAGAQQASGAGPTTLLETTEQPIEHLIRVVESLSPETLRKSVNWLKYEGSADLLIGGGTCDSGGISEMESVTAFPETTVIEENKFLKEEIKTINKRLITTVVEMCDEKDSSTAAAYQTGDSQAKFVKCFFLDLASIHTSVSGHAQRGPIQPLKLLVPGAYPRQSPLVLDELSALVRDGDAAASMSNEEDLTRKAISKLQLSLKEFEEPLSLEKIVKAWDAFFVNMQSSLVVAASVQCMVHGRSVIHRWCNIMKCRGPA